MPNERTRSLVASGQKVFAATSALFVLVTATTKPAIAAPEEGGPVFKRKPAAQASVVPKSLPGEMIITSNKSLDQDELKSAITEVNGQIVDTMHIGDKQFTVVKVDQKEFSKSFDKLRKNKNFQSVDLNSYVQSDGFPLTGLPNDPGLFNQPQIFVHRINLGWRIGGHYARAGGAGQTVGVLDTGVQGTNLDLLGKVLAGRNTVTDTNNGNIDLGDQVDNPVNPFYHGTFCASIIAMNTNNGRVGASYDYNALINPVDIFNGKETASTANTIKGFEFLANQPNVRIINISVGGSTFPFIPAYQAAVQAFCQAKDGLVFHSAGNSSLRVDVPRNNFDISVAAVDSNLQLAPFSNYGPYITFAGLGVGDGGSNRDGTALINADGTSFSTPTVCSIAVNMLALNPRLTGQQLLALMKRGCIPLPANLELGFGLPDAVRCADLVLHSR